MKSSPNLDVLNYSLNCLQSQKCLAGSLLQRDHQVSQISPIFHQLSKFHKVLALYFALNFTAKRIAFTKKYIFKHVKRFFNQLHQVFAGLWKLHHVGISPSFHRVFSRFPPNFRNIFARFSRFSPGFTSPSFHQALSGKKAAGFQRSVVFPFM